jgi:hypothetical protein
VYFTQTFSVCLSARHAGIRVIKIWVSAISASLGKEPSFDVTQFGPFIFSLFLIFSICIFNSYILYYSYYYLYIYVLIYIYIIHIPCILIRRIKHLISVPRIVFIFSVLGPGST